jgi:DNA protecting protein DprA
MVGLATRKRREEDDRERYHPPAQTSQLLLQELLRQSGRTVEDKQFDLLRSYGARDAYVYCAGDASLLLRPTVSVVGTREVSDEGRRRAARLARELALKNVVVMSGLAKGVDTAALCAAIEAGGKSIAVIGTPLEKAYPAENAKLQEEIYSSHLLISPFQSGEPVYKSNFPKRNRVMALLSDATVIIEASDTSGTLHQAAECLRQGRWLFILKSVAEDPTLKWPTKFVGKPRVIVLTSTSEITDAIFPEACALRRQQGMSEK